MSKSACVIIPAYNEEGNIKTVAEAVEEVFKNLPHDYYILFVDDGSTDKSFAVILELHQKHPQVRGFSLSRNFGHQIALLAGIKKAKGDIIITMDGDGQHPAELIPSLLQKQKQGCLSH